MIKGRGMKELEQLKSFSLKIQEATSKNVVITEKEKGMCQASHIAIPTRGIYLHKLPLLLTLQMNQPFSVMFQLLKILL